jgi:hypothetical protein
MVLALTSLDIALAGVIATAFVGLAGPFVGAFIARGNREHERSLAQDERIYAAASGAYEALVRSAYRMMTMVNVFYGWQKDPHLPDPGIPQFESQEEVIEKGGRVATFGSESVLEAYQAFRSAVSDFFTEAPDVDLLKAGGPKAEEALHASDERRKVAAAKYEALGEQVRAELRK